jgi:hypothetical protein
MPSGITKASAISVLLQNQSEAAKAVRSFVEIGSVGC